MIQFNIAMGGEQGISSLNALLSALNFWQGETVVTLGHTVKSHNVNADCMLYAECTTAGTTGATEPAWTEKGTTVADGTAVWTIKDFRESKTAEQAAQLTTARKINGVDFDGTKDITLPNDSIDKSSYIGNGLKISNINGLNTTISQGSARISGKNIINNGGDIALDARKASLLYLDADNNLGKVNAGLPTDFTDDHTVGLWLFNERTAGSNIKNSAVGHSALAVENDLVQHGGISSVDGWFDYALKLDGTTGYFSGSNTTNFPSGAAEREINVLVTIDKISSISTQMIVNYGAPSNGAYMALWVGSNGALTIDSYNTYVSTGFTVEVGKTYLFTVKYDGINVYIFVNGALIYKNTFTFVTGSAYSLWFGQTVGGGANYIYATYHFAEIRNKMRTDDQSGVIANKLMLPCFYNKPKSAYPTLPTAVTQSGYHEWKFNDTNATVVDTAGTANGTANGTTIIDSELGLGKARYFNGVTTDYIDIGNITYKPDMTIIAVCKPSLATTNGRIIGSTAVNSMILSCNDGTNGRVFMHNGTTWIDSGIAPNINKNNFISCVIKSDQTYFRVNEYESTVAGGFNKTVTCASSIGKAYDTTHPLKGSIDYLLFIPQALTPAEISKIYDALMKKGRRNILDDIIPSNAVSLGFIRTNSEKILEYNDKDYKYGRREGATGGNRKVFLGWKWFSGTTNLYWQSPFGTGKVDRTFNYADDANGTNEVPTYGKFEAGGIAYGVSPTAEIAGYNDAQNITLRVRDGWLTTINGVSKTSGYIGCYAEVMEDFKGVYEE